MLQERRLICIKAPRTEGRSRAGGPAEVAAARCHDQSAVRVVSQRFVRNGALHCYGVVLCLIPAFPLSQNQTPPIRQIWVMAKFWLKAWLHMASLYNFWQQGRYCKLEQFIACSESWQLSVHKHMAPHLYAEQGHRYIRYGER